MANVLAAIGGAAPAIMGTFKDYLDISKRMREEEKEPERWQMEKQAWQTRMKGMETEQAISQETLAQEKQKTERAKQEASRRNSPFDVNTVFKPLKMTPEFAEFSSGLLEGHGFKGGLGTVGQFEDAMPKILQNPLFGNMIKGQTDYVLGNYKKAAEDYQNARQGGDHEKVDKAYARMKEWEQASMAWGGVQEKTRQYIDVRGKMLNQINELKNNKVPIPQDTLSALESMAEIGDEAGFREMWKQQVAGSLDIAKAMATHTGKVPSSGNAVDTAIRRKFGTRALTDPELAEKADRWLATAEGKQAVREAAQDVTPPAVTYLQTSEGLVPAATKGPYIGTIGAPTGLGKPIPAEETSKLAGLNAMLNDIDQVKNLYQYGSEKEKNEWVGPVSGRVGGIREKYTGGASEDQVKFYAYVRDLKDALLRARSGAQINEQEYKRLVSFLPDENLPAKSFNARLDRFEAEVNNLITSKKKSLKESGYGKQETPKAESKRDRAIAELNKRGKVVNEDSIKKAIELIGD